LEVKSGHLDKGLFWGCGWGNDHPHIGWLGFCRQRRQKTEARSTLIVENNAVKPWILVQSTRFGKPDQQDAPG
jgi:hypothetical protein